MTEAKRGRPRKAVEIAKPADGALTVKVADTIHDGAGGFLAVGAKFHAADPEALKARGLAE
jgi:hypothetical protein